MKPTLKEIRPKPLPKTLKLANPKPAKPNIRHYCNGCGISFASLRGLGRHQRRMNSHCSSACGVASASGLLDVEHTAATLANATPFFINSLGQYQFNTNENRHAINCPFCILHKTSLQGLAKHCAAAHRPQYLAWRAGSYGKVLLRCIPPDETLANQVMQILKDAGLLDKDIPMTDASCLLRQRPTPRKRPKRPSTKRNQLGASECRKIAENWRKFCATAAMETERLSPPLLSPPSPPPQLQPLPPPPPLIDCRSLAATATSLPIAVADSNAPLSSYCRRYQKKDLCGQSDFDFFCNSQQLYRCNNYPEQEQQFFRQHTPYYSGGQWELPPPQQQHFSYADVYYHQAQFEQSAFSLPQTPMSGYGYGHDHGQGNTALGYYPSF